MDASLKWLLRWLVMLVLSFFLSVLLINFRCSKERECVEYDTIYVHDTITVEKPVARDSIVIRTEYLKVRVRDTVRDTALVEIPIMQKRYETDNYKAYVSGYKPSLDSLYIYREKERIVRYRDPSRWSVGISAGYGMTPNGFQPYLGISVNYQIKLKPLRNK